MKFLKATGATLALGVLLAGPMAMMQAHAATPSVVESQEATLNISGTATRQVAPDYAVLTLGLETKGNTVSEAKSQNDAIMSQLIANVLKEGITKNAIMTSDFSVRPDYSYKNGQESQKPTGYTVNNHISIRINDINKVSTIIDAASASGVNMIDSLRFFSDEAVATDDILMRDAVKDARHKAEVLASALGLRIMSVKTVSVNRTQTSSDAYNGMALRSMAATTTPVEQGQLSISKTVNISYILG